MFRKSDFLAMVDDFGKHIDGKTGVEFNDAVVTFMRKNNFAQNIITRIYEDDSCRIMFYSDDVLNNYGLMFFESFNEDSKGFVAMCSKRDLQKEISEFLKIKGQ